MPDHGEVTELLHAYAGGDRDAFDRLVPWCTTSFVALPETIVVAPTGVPLSIRPDFECNR